MKERMRRILMYRRPFEQWYGWSTEKGYHRDGLLVLHREAIADVTWMMRHIETLLEKGNVSKDWFGEPVTVIDDYHEERYYEDLESLRNSINYRLKVADKRRPLKRRIELLRNVTVEHGAEPGEQASAEARIAALEKRLEER